MDIEQCESEVLAPSSLTAILEPSDALAAAQRMQRWYQTAQGAAHSLFGRDGRRVEGRLATEVAMGATFDATA